jgi:hypothetical protein
MTIEEKVNVTSGYTGFCVGVRVHPLCSLPILHYPLLD